jgi:hypothetical protein
LFVVRSGPFDIVIEGLVEQRFSILRLWARTRREVISPIEEVFTNDRAGAVEIKEVLGGQREMWAAIEG